MQKKMCMLKNPFIWLRKVGAHADALHVHKGWWVQQHRDRESIQGKGGASRKEGERSRDEQCGSMSQGCTTSDWSGSSLHERQAACHQVQLCAGATERAAAATIGGPRCAGACTGWSTRGCTYG